MQSDTEESLVNQEGVPQGYEAISLIEALNGQVVPPVNNEGVFMFLFLISSELLVHMFVKIGCCGLLASVLSNLLAC